MRRIKSPIAETKSATRLSSSASTACALLAFEFERLRLRTARFEQIINFVFLYHLRRKQILYVALKALMPFAAVFIRHV
jgi:hypothetical protein